MRQIRTIKGVFTKKELERILGKPDWEWDTCEDEEPECGLSPGKMWSAGWGNFQACCRIWIHSDGICIGAGLDTPADYAYADELYQKIMKEAKNGTGISQRQGD